MKIFTTVKRALVPVGAVVGSSLVATSAFALDVSTITAELAENATAAGTICVAALGVAGVLMAGMMLVRRI